MTEIKTKHPAKYSKQLLPIFQRMLKGCNNVLDPFAGVGTIHSLPFKTTGVEIEEEWANQHKNTVLGDATKLIFNDGVFDGVCTSPTYGNRMADCHIAKDKSKRNTYTHTLGKQLNNNNSGKMQWGDSYKKLHEKAWLEVFRVLKNDGVLVLNIKNHIRKGLVVDVFSWHVKTLLNIGFSIEEIQQVPVNGNGFGSNGKTRIKYEFVALFRKPKNGNNGRNDNG